MLTRPDICGNVTQNHEWRKSFSLIDKHEESAFGEAITNREVVRCALRVAIRPYECILVHFCSTRHSTQGVRLSVTLARRFGSRISASQKSCWRSKRQATSSINPEFRDRTAPLVTH